MHVPFVGHVWKPVDTAGGIFGLIRSNLVESGRIRREFGDESKAGRTWLRPDVSEESVVCVVGLHAVRGA
jgi:hypothetical protein